MARTNMPIVDAEPRPHIIDGLQNLISGMGGAQDKRSFNMYGQGRVLMRFELDAMYRDSWLAGRVVDSVADDMTREWVTVTFDDNTPESRSAIENAEKRFDIQNKFNEGIKWARLYGGSIGVIGIGSEDLSKPLDITTVKKGSLRYFHILDRWRVSGSPTLCTDLNSANFGLPDSYLIAESGISIHHTRVIRFNGRKLPYFLWQQNARWDDSELQHVFTAISDNDANTSSVGTMMFEANIDVITNKSLADALSSDQGTAQVAKRYSQANLMKSLNRMLLLDGEETHTKVANSFANLDKIMDKGMLNVCGAADIPATRLFGMSPAGMSATGESDSRNYDTRISCAQETQLRHPVEYFYEIMARSELGYLPDNFEVSFNALRQTSPTEQATIDYQRAQTDQIYLNASVVTEGVVARELKERGVYPNMTDDEIEMVEELALAPPAIPGPPIPPNPNQAVKKGVDPAKQPATMQLPADGGE